MLGRDDLAINETAYEWSVRLFALLQKRLGLEIHEHGADGQLGTQLETGQIFLFNHFARFEAVIPQYIIYRETGAHCRSVAAHELCAGDGRFAKFLRGIGGVPNNLEGLLPFLAAEILRGRKVVVFPEGGMVKDRQVVDEAGDFSIFSPSANSRRKHHKGAAATALILEIFKRRILSLQEAGETARLARWVDALELEDQAALIAAARKPTRIVPANITFFPIRAEENIFKRVSDIFAKDLRDELREELLIEGNFILKQTDMDIRFGAPVSPHLLWRWWDRLLLGWSFSEMDSLDELFALDAGSDRWADRLALALIDRNTRRLRDQCMSEMYRLVTTNLGHLFSQLTLQLVADGRGEIERGAFHRALYLSLKYAQGDPSIHLHASLADPERYCGIDKGASAGLADLLAVAEASGLIEVTQEHYRFLPKLTAGHDFHQVRLENIVQVYANEVAPVEGARAAVSRALEDLAKDDRKAFAELLFDDELRRFAKAEATYNQDRYREINAAETATESGAPLLFLPDEPGDLGIVLVHGLLASPAELKGFAERLRDLGYPVLVIRLAGHGTSPSDLRERSWQEWLASLRRGFALMAGLAARVSVIGFSTGGGLALRLAAERPPELAGVIAVSAPIKLRNKILHFVPVLHSVNKVAEWSSALEGLMPFRLNESEHPEINYRQIPIRALYELRRSIDDLKRKLPDVVTPVAIIQGTEDPVVDPKSAELIYGKIASRKKRLHDVESDRHGILHEDIGDTQDVIVSFLESLSERVVERQPARQAARCAAARPEGDAAAALSDLALKA
jgi:esterase/lipase